MPIPANVVNANNVQNNMNIDFNQLEQAVNSGKYVYVTKDNQVKTEGWFSHLFTSKATINRTKDFLQNAFKAQFEKSLDKDGFSNTFNYFIKNGTQPATQDVRAMINSYKNTKELKEKVDNSINTVLDQCKGKDNEKLVKEFVNHEKVCKEYFEKVYKKRDNPNGKQMSPEKINRYIDDFVKTLNKHINDAYDDINEDIKDDKLQYNEKEIQNSFSAKLCNKLDGYKLEINGNPLLKYAAFALANRRYDRFLSNINELIDFNKIDKPKSQEAPIKNSDETLQQFEKPHASNVSDFVGEDNSEAAPTIVDINAPYEGGK